MPNNAMYKFVDKFWDREVMPALSDFVRIPCVSMSYEKTWQTNGYLEKALELVANWAKQQNIAGLTVKILKIKGLSPVLYINVPAFLNADNSKSVLFTGHLDKMPVVAENWSKGLHPWKPVLKNGKLYGRGVADDGYATFVYLAAIKALQEQQLGHSRCVFFIETAEESGSIGFDKYLAKYKKLLGDVRLIVNFDTGCDDYQHLWCTYSTRGVIDGVLRIEVLKATKHSGMVTGIVPTPMQIARQLLDRICDSKSGEVLLKQLHTTINAKTKKMIRESAKFLGSKIASNCDLLPGVKPLSKNLNQLVLNANWKPTICVTGMDGLPSSEKALSAVQPNLTLVLSVRLPPNCDPDKANQVLQKSLEKNPPYNAKVTYTPFKGAKGWCQDVATPWLDKLVDDCSKRYFGAECKYNLIGGTIGIFSDLQKEFPKAAFFVSGLLGEGSNEHGPDENLNIAASKKITCCLADVLKEMGDLC